MLRKLLWAGVLLTCMAIGVCAREPSWTCLPVGIKTTDVVSTQTVRAARGGREIRKITVAQKLRELKAQCRKGKLVDSARTEIRFYKLNGCWGSPPNDYRDIMDRQARDLATLKKRYRVIELTCNPSGEQIPRAPSSAPPDSRLGKSVTTNTASSNKSS